MGCPWERGVNVHPKLDTAGSRAALAAVPASLPVWKGFAMACPSILDCAGIQEHFLFKPCTSNTGCGVSWGSCCDFMMLFRFHSVF